MILVLGFDSAVSGIERDSLSVWLNGKPLTSHPCEEINTEWQKDIGQKGVPSLFPDIVRHIHTWSLPLDTINDDTNIVEILPPHVPGNLIWAEILIK